MAIYGDIKVMKLLAQPYVYILQVYVFTSTPTTRKNQIQHVMKEKNTRFR